VNETVSGEQPPFLSTEKLAFSCGTDDETENIKSSETNNILL
jgi:hypothetical protein